MDSELCGFSATDRDGPLLLLDTPDRRKKSVNVNFDPFSMRTVVEFQMCVPASQESSSKLQNGIQIPPK